MSSTTQVLFASRIPGDLKERLSRFCARHGVKMNFLVSQAIREKLEQLIEDEADVALIKARLKDAEFVPQEEMDRYLKKRFGKH